MTHALSALRGLEPVEPRPGESFQDRIIWLIAALCVAERQLTYAGYRQAQQALERVFGERALEAGLQAKLMFALTHPGPEPVELAKDMAHQADRQMVAASLIEAMLAALAGVCAARSQDVEAAALYQEIEWAFRKVHLERADARDAGWAMRLGLEVTDSLAGLYRLSKRLLVPEGRAPGLLAPEAARYNLHARDYVADLERMARTMEDTELLDEVRAFCRFMTEQPYRIVVAGERKRGKSSIVNALVGRALSPVRETAPETATVIEFRHADAPDYSVRFLDAAQFAHLEGYLAGEAGNTLLEEKIRTIRQGVEHGVFVPGKLLAGVTSWEDLPDYVAAGGRYADVVARVSVSLPLASLRDGVVVVDTPGLNDTDAFHDYLSYEESLSADGLLFVMDARNPGAASELGLLRRLARSGRTVGVIGVLTHIDKLDEAGSQEQAVEQAAAVLREACREAAHVRVYGVAAINAREAMRERTAEKPGAPEGQFAYLLRLMQDMMAQDTARNEYRKKRAANFARLVTLARAGIGRYVERGNRELPDAQVLAMLKSHADRLNEAAGDSLAQARRIVGLVGNELDNWDRESARNLENFRDALALRLMEAVHQEMDAAGNGFAAPAVWKRFEAGPARRIARECVEQFLEHEQIGLAGWEQRLRTFTNELNTLAARCLERAALEAEALGAAAVSGSEATHLLVRTHQHMKALAVFTGGAAAGAAAGMTPALFLLTAGNVLSLAAASPAVLAAAAVAVGAVEFVRRFGNPEKRKADFVKKKHEETAAYAERVCAVLRKELGAVRADVGRSYEQEVRRGFMPALDNLFEQAMHIQGFLAVMARVKADAARYEISAGERLHTLEQAVK